MLAKNLKPRGLRAVRLIAVASVCLMPAACGSSESAPATTKQAAAADASAGSSSDSKVVHGACSSRSDVYTRGYIAKKNEHGVVASDLSLEIRDHLIIKDGPSGSNSRVNIAPDSYSDKIIQQIREGIEQFDNQGVKARDVYLLGEKRGDDDDYDGQLNKGVYAACLS